MLERMRQRQEESRTRSSADFLDDSDGGGMVTVSHGVHTESLPVAGMTVAQIRTRLADRFDIDPEGQAVIEGHHVGDEVVVGANQLLLFVKKAGVKGIAVISGVHCRHMAEGGGTVGQLRERLAGDLQIPPQAVAVLDGSNAGEGTLVTPQHQCLAFVRPAGIIGPG